MFSIRFSRLRVPVYYLFVALLAIGISYSGQSQPTAFKPDRNIQKSSDLPNPLKAEVIGIQDGDTIELKFLYSGKKAGHRIGKPIRIRLLHVNCPERGKAFYKVARQFTSDQCFRKVVRIRHTGEFDKYGRLLGEVVLPDGKILNKELVKKGLAVHFKKYSKSTEYANLENQARKQKLGIWSQQGFFFGKL